jgi:predicted dehydrogenase
MKRRHFVQSCSTVVAGAAFVPFSLIPNAEPIKLAILGTGWWGTDFLLKNAIATGQFEIIALCDINSVALNNAANVVVELGGKKPQLFSAYQEMYKIPGLQAVAIATPTHWHALHFIAACKAGLHVFLEKPISYDIREGQAMLEAHRKAKNVVIVDFPRTMLDTNNQVKSFIQSGKAGKILQIQANIHNPGGNLVEKPIPATFDFDTFCGPAPRAKYLCNEKANTPNWRGQHVFNRGHLADWGIHYIHNIRKVMDLGLPNNVSAIGGIVRNFTIDNPDHLEVQFDFGGLPVLWSHKIWGFISPTPRNNIGVYYFGEKATIFAGDQGWEVYPGNNQDKIVQGDIEFNPGKPDQMKKNNQAFQDLFNQFTKGIRTNSNAEITNTLEDAFITTSSIIYADMAYLAKSNLVIDAKTMDIKNNTVAQGMLKRKYRAPYQHPYAS